MVLNGAEWYWIVPNGTKWCWMVPNVNGAERYQLVPNGSKWCRMVPNGAEWCWMVALYIYMLIYKIPYSSIKSLKALKSRRYWKLCVLVFKVRTDKSKNWHNLESFYLILAEKLVLNQMSGLRCNQGCAPYAQSWMFFQNVQNTDFFLLFYSACKKATAMVF